MEDSHNLRDVKRLSLPFECGPEDGLCQGEMTASQECAAATGRFIISTCHFLKCKVIYHLKTCNFSSATDKSQNHMLSKCCTFFNEQRETPCDLSSWQNSSSLYEM